MDDSFQQRVFIQLASIPKGRVVSYGRLAQLASNPGAARAVGNCLRQLPKNTQLPWHRVVRANGEIAFAGRQQSAEIQRKRLMDEGVEVIENRCNLKRFGY